jgi:hypothetical protein
LSKIQVGDLVKLNDPTDVGRNIGIVVGVSKRPAHLVSYGKTNIILVYWPKIQDTDWEYDFFLLKLEEPDLTKKEG